MGREGEEKEKRRGREGEEKGKRRGREGEEKGKRKRREGGEMDSLETTDNMLLYHTHIHHYITTCTATHTATYKGIWFLVCPLSSFSFSAFFSLLSCCRVVVC